MVLQRIRRAAAVLALAATLALAAPAHAAGWRDLARGPGWIESALEWVARLWVAEEAAARLKPAATPKACAAIDPNGCPSVPAPPPGSNAGS